MDVSLLFLVIFAIEVVVQRMIKFTKNKPDILRIWYEDVPFTHIVGPSVLYYIALFQFLDMNISPIVLCIHLLNKTLIRCASLYAKNKYDYFNLLHRYHETFSIYNHFLIETVYLVVVIGVFKLVSYVNNIPSTYLNLMVSALVFMAITLTFEDV